MIKIHLTLILTAILSLQGYAQSLNLGKDNLAIQGYDPVGYFEAGKAIKGNKMYNSTYRGAQYWFASEENLQKFEQAPKTYEPQYGGWCAYAIAATGDKVKIDPATFKVTGGKLYLFYNFRNTNTLTLWNKDEKNLLEKANLNWMKQLKQ